MRKQKLLTLLAVTVIAISVVSVNADLLVYEPFDYEGTELTGQGGAIGTVGTWTSNDASGNISWGVYKEGTLSGRLLWDGATPVTFDGTVANLPTMGSYVGLSGGYKLNADIALDPSVTESFQSGTTTWICYVSVRAFDRNAEQPNLVIGTIPAPTGSRGDDYGGIGSGGSGLGTGGGPNRDNRTSIYPMFYKDGQYNNVQGPIPSNSYAANSATFVDGTGALSWVPSDDDGFGAANIVIVKIEWDADTNGEDIISVARFLEDEEITEAAFDAMIASKPNLTSANWAAANKPNLDQSQFDTLTFMGIKYFVDEIRFATTFGEAIGGSSDRIPSNGSSVGVGDVLLSWVNLLPTAPETKVYTDVYFGTDPCDLPQIETIPASGEDVNSVTVTIPAPGDYYWKVEMYTRGDGVGEPNVLATWRVTAVDLSPEVTILTPDMMTWSGEPVGLDCDIVDDGFSPVSTAWSTDLPEGITAEFIPDATSEDTSVKLTKVPYFVSYLANGSFENPALADKAAVNTNGVASWSTQWSVAGAGTWANDGSPNGGAWDPNDLGDFVGVLPDGENTGYVNVDAGYDHCLYQETSATVEAGAQYDLSVKIGNPSKYNGGTTNDYRIELLVNGRVAASAAGASPVDDQSWITAEVSYTGADPNVGEAIAVRLISEAAEAKRLCFDDVQLSINGEPGEMVDPAAVVGVKVTVEVSDAVNTTSKSITIDVYDDDCSMAILGEGKGDANPTDLNGDCITDINDILILAAKWLDNKLLPGPIAE